jgi:hypothetical protein
MVDKNSKEFSSVLDSDGNIVADPFRKNEEEAKSEKCSSCGNPLEEVYFHHRYCQD